MASATTGVRHPKGPLEAPAGPKAGAFFQAILDSTVGAKILVALTGLGLVTFVLFHMIGNLKLFQGPEAINHYAYFLKHDLGALIWIARAGLLGIFVLHLALAIRLKLRSRSARPVAYAYPGSVQAGVAARTMIWTGIVILLFTLFHLAHFTFGYVSGVNVMNVSTGEMEYTNYLELKDAKGQHNVYEMMVAGFREPVLALFYVVCQVVLFLHLRHGIPSTFQTLGLKNARFRKAIDAFGLLIALTILIGNCAIVLSAYFGYVKSQI